MRRRTLMNSGGGVVEASKAQPCDICLYDKTNDKLIIVESSKFTSTIYASTSYSPVGVVVVPGSHDVYRTEECAIISIVAMSYYTPDTGTTSVYQDMYYGGDGTDISSLPNLDQTPYVGIGSDVGDSTSTVVGQYIYPYLPSDKFSAVQCPHDTDTYYYSTSSQCRQSPSPFLTDGSRNPAYYQTSSPSSTSNALADFDGVGNTNILTGLATSQSDWKTATTITNDSGTGYYPAACCCWRYHTDGTKQGDWYLPAMGELGYIMPNFNKINTAINTLINSYDVGVQLGSSQYFWSSSEISSSTARYLYTDGGTVRNHNKSNTNFVRAFLRVK